MIYIAIALIVWAGALAYAARCWKRVKVSEMDLARTLSNNNRATAERLERATQRFYDQLRSGIVRSDDLRPPPGDLVRPHFGQKPHIAVDNDHPEGAA